MDSSWLSVWDVATPEGASALLQQGISSWGIIILKQDYFLNCVTSWFVVWHIFIHSALSIIVAGKCKAVLFSQKEEPTLTSTKSSGTSGLEDMRRQVMFFFFLGTYEKLSVQNKCTFCGKKIKTKVVLNNHIRCHHSSYRYLPCRQMTQGAV